MKSNGSMNFQDESITIDNEPSNPIPVVDVGGSATPTTQRIVNDTYNTINAIQSTALTNGTRSFEIKHSGTGDIELGFTPTLTEFWTVNKGNSFLLEGLNTNNETVYYRSNKTGTIEILEVSN